MRDCKSCLHKTVDGCDSWKCEYINRYDAAEAYRQTRWIPVTERLPEETADYLGWVINPYDESIQYHMICAYYAGAKKWYPIDETASSNVVAWMPLPKAYEERAMRLIDKKAESAEMSSFHTMTMLKREMTILKQANMSHRRKGASDD